MTAQELAAQELINYWDDAIKQINDAIQALIVVIEKLAKRFCNLIAVLAMISISEPTKHALKRGVYRSLLYQKVTIESLRLRLSNDQSNP